MTNHICDLSKREIGDLLRINFFKIGIKAEPNLEELETFISDIYKNQGSKTTEAFVGAFDALSAGSIDVRDKWNYSPSFVNRLMRVYRANKPIEKKPHQEGVRLTDEEHWKLFFRHIAYYGSLPVKPNWIALFNYCVAKGWIIEVTSIKEYSIKAKKLAEKDVTTFVMANWAEKITDANKYMERDKR